MARAGSNRGKILDIAEAAVLAKGFEATSIEEIVAEAGLTKGGFFYHFRDKNELAAALMRRYIEEDDKLIGGVLTRATELSDDPLQRLLIALRLFAELIEDMPNGHPGCLIATAAYQERSFAREVHDLNRKALLTWRARIRALLDEALTCYRLTEPVDLDDLADMVTANVEGAIVLSKAIRDPLISARQMMTLRACIKRMFEPLPAA